MLTTVNNPSIFCSTCAFTLEWNSNKITRVGFAHMIFGDRPSDPRSAVTVVADGIKSNREAWERISGLWQHALRMSETIRAVETGDRLTKDHITLWAFNSEHYKMFLADGRTNDVILDAHLWELIKFGPAVVCDYNKTADDYFKRERMRLWKHIKRPSYFPYDLEDGQIDDRLGYNAMTIAYYARNNCISHKTGLPSASHWAGIWEPSA